MESSSVEFCVTDQATTNSGAAGETSFSTDEKSVNIKLGKDATNISTMAHELRHGYGYLNGEMIGAKGRDPLYDMMDEVTAFNAGFLFLDRKTANLQADGYYNLDWFKNTQMKNPLYSSLAGREQQLTVNTSAATFLQYNPAGRLSSALKNNANMTVQGAIDYLNFHSEKLYGKPEYYTGTLLNNR